MLIIKKLLVFFIDTYNVNKRGEEYRDGMFEYKNWWKSNLDEQWFTHFIKRNNLNVDSAIVFYSLFGPCDVLDEKNCKKKVFYTGENVTHRVHHSRLRERSEKVLPLDNRISKYENYLKKGTMDLVLTFCPDGLDNAIRFPYWLLSHFDECSSYSDVKKRIMQIETNYHKVNLSRRGAVNISSHDFFGTRADICDSLDGIVDIKYAGRWRNNTDELQTKYGNCKIEYLSNFRFNICPENMDAKDYVTEKIWDSFEAGCIPIYSGALGNPEPNIFNKEAFFLWSYDSGNECLVKQIQKAEYDDMFYCEMKRKNVFVDGAAEYIYSLLKGFRDKMESLMGDYE